MTHNITKLGQIKPKKIKAKFLYIYICKFVYKIIAVYSFIKMENFMGTKFYFASINNRAHLKIAKFTTF